MKQSLKFLKSLLLLIKRILIFMVGWFLILLLGVWVLKIDCHELGKIFFDSGIEEINPLMRWHVSYLIDVDWKTIETYDRGLYTDVDPLIVSLVLTWYETKNLENKAPARNLVQEVKEYQNKKAKKLIIENKPKNEE